MLTMKIVLINAKYVVLNMFWFAFNPKVQNAGGGANASTCPT